MQHKSEPLRFDIWIADPCGLAEGGPGCGRGALLDAWQLETVLMSAALRLMLDEQPAAIP